MKTICATVIQLLLLVLNVKPLKELMLRLVHGVAVFGCKYEFLANLHVLSDVLLLLPQLSRAMWSTIFQ